MAGSLLALNSCDNEGELHDINPEAGAQMVKDLEESTELFLSIGKSHESQNDIDAQAKATQTKALAMLEAEGIPAKAETYPTTGDFVVFLPTNNAFVNQGTYLPKEYKGDRPEYQGVMALRHYGVSGIAHNDSRCLIVDGDPKTEPTLAGC